MKRYVVAITGASGAAYARRLIGVLLAAGHHVDLMVTAAGFQVLRHELDWGDPRYAGGGLVDRLDRFFRPAGAPGPLRFHPLGDLTSDIASGSVRVEAMVVIPCTMGRVAAIAAGRSGDLLERAADVTIKEGRPLVVVPREMPLSLVHLRNLTALAECGVVVMPAMPAFYHRPRSLDDVVDFVVARVLARIGVETQLVPPWDRLKGGSG